MEKEFVPYQQSFNLKKLGFNEPCLKFYATEKLILGLDTENGDTNSKLNEYNPLFVSSPTFSQAFRWFREKYGLHSIVVTNLCSPIKDMWFMYQVGREGEGDYFKKVANFTSYEEAELECLKKLIEIVKEKNE